MKNRAKIEAYNDKELAAWITAMVKDPVSAYVDWGKWLKSEEGECPYTVKSGRYSPDMPYDIAVNQSGKITECIILGEHTENGDSRYRVLDTENKRVFSISSLNISING